MEVLVFRTFGIILKILLIRYFYSQYKSDIHEKGRWSTFDVNTFDHRMFWREPLVPWDEPVYPEEMDDEESPSVADEEENGSEFIPSGSASE